MRPAHFPEANKYFGAPPEFEESQVMTIPAHVCEATSGSCDGVPIVVVAWLPDREDMDRMMRGQPVYLTCIGGLPPHYLSTDFQQATHPA